MPGTLRFSGNLARLHVRMGKNELALTLYRANVERSRRVLGRAHPDSLRATGSLGHLVGKMGDLVAAVPQLQEAIEGLTAAYSEEHRDVLMFQRDLDDVNAWVKQRAGRSRALSGSSKSKRPTQRGITQKDPQRGAVKPSKRRRRR